MRKILSIEHIEQRRAAMSRKVYQRTHAILDDGTEAVGFGDDFEIGNLVEVFFHKGTVKMRRPLDNSNRVR